MAKELTVREMASMGGVARAKTHSKAQLHEWGKQGGRPAKLNEKGLARLRELLASGKTQAECAKALRVSVRTIGRAVGQTKARTGAKTS